MPYWLRFLPIIGATALVPLPASASRETVPASGSSRAQLETRVAKAAAFLNENSQDGSEQGAGTYAQFPNFPNFFNQFPNFPNFANALAYPRGMPPGPMPGTPYPFPNFPNFQNFVR